MSRSLEYSQARASFVVAENELDLRIFFPETSALTLIPNSVPVPGALAALDGGSNGWDYLIGGRDAMGSGVLQCVHDSGSGVYGAAGVASVAGADICGIAFSSTLQTLFVLDASQPRVLSSSYSVGGSLPSSWTTIAVPAQVPELVDAVDYSLFLTDGLEPQFELREYGPVIPRCTNFTLLSNGNIRHDGSKPGSRDFSALLEGSVVPDATSVEVAGPALAVVHIVEIDGSPSGITVGSATTDSAGHATVALSQPIHEAKVYAARTATIPEPTEPFVVPVRRWGPSTAAELKISTGLQLRPWGNIGSQFYVGNDSYYFALTAEPREGQSIVFPNTFKANLVLGVLGVSAIDSTAQGPMLMGSWYSMDELEVIDATGASAIVSAPIPNDQGLTGVVVLAQWVVEDPGTSGFFLSDIVGVRIRSHASQSPSQLRPAGAGVQPIVGMSAPASTAQVDRIRIWMKQARFKNPKALLRRARALLATRDP